MSHWAKIQPNLQVHNVKKPQKRQKINGFSCLHIKAKPFFGIDITSAHNPTDQETVAGFLDLLE